VLLLVELELVLVKVLEVVDVVELVLLGA